MKRLLATTILGVFLASACASYQGRSEIDSAKLAYLDAALAYNVAADTIVDLRELRKITDSQWARFKQAQKVVRTNAPLVRAGIDLWERTGAKPATLGVTLYELTEAFTEVAKINREATQ